MCSPACAGIMDSCPKDTPIGVKVLPSPSLAVGLDPPHHATLRASCEHGSGCVNACDMRARACALAAWVAGASQVCAAGHGGAKVLRPHLQPNCAILGSGTALPVVCGCHAAGDDWPADPDRGALLSRVCVCVCAFMCKCVYECVSSAQSLADAQCGPKASCKPISSVGICTYDS
jgi:hypothetical protein